MQMHELKTVNPYFSLTWDGKKDFEIRKNDRDFQDGDILWLREFDKEDYEHGIGIGYTGRSMLASVEKIVIPENAFIGLANGYCAMTIKVMRREPISPKDYTAERGE